MIAAEVAEIDAFLGALVCDLAPRVRARFGTPGPVRFKSPGQPVTQVDADIERRAVRAIGARWPGHAIVGEEGAARRGTSGFTWYVDPIDGTANFMRGVPFFAVAIGVVFEGQPVAGHVIDPLRNEHFRACAGGGAWLNERRLEITGNATLDTVVTYLQTRHGDRLMDDPGLLHRLHSGARKVRCLGALALELAYLAAGRADLVVAGREKPLAWWDIAAGWALVTEAGGRVTDLAGDPLDESARDLVAGAPALVSAFLSLRGGGRAG
jgi:myo-inositol-1(or 4)-monophosphatase